MYIILINQLGKIILLELRDALKGLMWGLGVTFIFIIFLFGPLLEENENLNYI